MNAHVVIVAFAMAATLGVGCNRGSEDGAVRLTGIAEDLWGNQMNLSRFDYGLLVIEPFSPSD